MSQQINLFNPLFRKKGFSFTSSTAMLYGLGIAVAAGAAAAVYEHSQLQEAIAVAQTVEQSHKAMTTRFDQLTAEVSQQKPNAQLAADIARLELQLKGRQEVIETLNSGVVGNTGGFSEYMRAFSRQNVNGLWLTAFDIARGGNELAIQGRALNADLVATYLKQLNVEKPLQGRQFAALRIGQPSIDPVDQSKAGAEKISDAAEQVTKEAIETKAAPPRYLDFAISTIDIPDDPKQAGKLSPAGVPLLGVGEPKAVFDNKKAVASQEAPR